MYRENSQVRKAARDIVMTYAHHIRDKVKSGDADYISLGVDNDFELYVDFFNAISKKTFYEDLKYSSSGKIKSIKAYKETVNIVKEMLISKNYNGLLRNKVIAECTYVVCLHVLETTKKNLFLEEEFEEVK
ncbi:hypothetical protein D3C71_1302070 [compost metagenome]